MYWKSGERRLRVAMLCGYRPTPAGGGTEKYVYELTQGLLRRGLDVDIICEDRSFLPDASNPLSQHIIGIAPRPQNGRFSIEQFYEKSQRLAEMIDPERYDVVHCHGHYGYHTVLRCAALERRPAVVSTFHLTAMGPIERYKQLGLGEPEEAPLDRAVACMEETMGRFSDKSIAVSRGVAHEIRSLYGVPPDRIQVLSNWYDAEVFRPFDQAMARRVLALKAGERYLLYVGHFRMSRGKIMADVLRSLPQDVTLLVAYHQSDDAISAEFGSRVRFTGHLSAQNLALYYSAVDLLCFPSLYGGFGLVLLEAMACACPPVVFNYPAMNEVVTEQSGYLVTQPTAAAYAAVIQRALREPRRKASGARRRAAAFDMHSQIDAMRELYGKMVGSLAPTLSV